MNLIKNKSFWLYCAALLALPFILGALFIPALMKPAAEFRQWKIQVEETAKSGGVRAAGPKTFEASIYGQVFFRFLTSPTLEKNGISGEYETP